MTKKKMRKTIIIGILMFFTASLIFAFMAASSSVATHFRDAFGDPVYTEFQELLTHFDDAIASEENMKNSNCNEGELLGYYLSEYYSGIKYPFVFAVVDEELNIKYIPNNFIYVNRWHDSDDLFIGLDEYLTEETKAEMRKFIRKARNDYYQVEEIKLCKNGEMYIPVSLELYCYDKNGNELRKNFKISDYNANITIDENDVNKPEINLYPCLREIKAPFYHRNNFSKYTESLLSYFELNKDNFSPNGGGGGASAGECSYRCGFEANGKRYEIYYAGGYDEIAYVLMSDYFRSFVANLVFLFAIAGFIFYIMCMKVITKSEKLDEAKSTFISGASHELKTPIAVIQNQCECIMENIAPEKNDEYIKSIYDEALRMNGIVSSLLSYSRLTQMTAVKKERCNLSELLREEIRNYSKFAQSSGVTIIEDIADDVYADCNAQLMRMAIGNYLSNAIKYSVGDKKVEVNLFKNKSTFTLAVINPADKNSVDIANEAWDELSRGDKSRQRQGTSIGMGLPICKKIFELHSFRGYCKYHDGSVSFIIVG